MEKLNENLSWYQAKIGNYDKQYWELSAEQRILQGLERRPKMKSGTSVLQPELIDVDLIRGSAYTKAKPLHNGRVIVWNGVMRVVFAPFYFRFWCQHTSEYFAILFMLHYALCVLHILLNFFYASRQTLWDEHSIPLLCTLLLGIIHAHIVAPVMHKKKKSSQPPEGGAMFDSLNSAMKLDEGGTALAWKLLPPAAAPQDAQVPAVPVSGKKKRRRIPNTATVGGIPIIVAPTTGGSGLPVESKGSIIPGTVALTGTETFLSDTGLETETPSEYTFSAVGDTDGTTSHPAYVAGQSSASSEGLQQALLNAAATMTNTLATSNTVSGTTDKTSTEPLSTQTQCDPADLQAFIHAKNKQIPDPVTYPDAPITSHCHNIHHHHGFGGQPHNRTCSLSMESGGGISRRLNIVNGELVDSPMPLDESILYAETTFPHPHHHNQPHEFACGGRDLREMSPFSQAQLMHPRLRHTSLGGGSTAAVGGTTPSLRGTRHASLSMEQESHGCGMKMMQTGRGGVSKDASRHHRFRTTTVPMQFSPQLEQTESCSSSSFHADNPDGEEMETLPFAEYSKCDVTAGGGSIHSKSKAKKRLSHSSKGSSLEYDHGAQLSSEGSKRAVYRQHGRYNSFAEGEVMDGGGNEEVFQVCVEDQNVLRRRRPEELTLPLEFDGHLHHPKEMKPPLNGKAVKISPQVQAVDKMLEGLKSLNLGHSESENVEDEDNLISPRSRDSASEHSDSHGNSADNSAAELSEDSDKKPPLKEYHRVNEATQNGMNGMKTKENNPPTPMAAVNGSNNAFDTPTSSSVKINEEQPQSLVITQEGNVETKASTSSEPAEVASVSTSQQQLRAPTQPAPSGGTGKFKLTRLEVNSIPDSPVALHTCKKEMESVEQAFLRDMPELNNISNEDTFTTNSRQKSKFETLFRIRSEVSRRCAATGESILCHKHHNAQGETDDDDDDENHEHTVLVSEANVAEKESGGQQQEDMLKADGGAAAALSTEDHHHCKTGTKGYASSTGGSSSGLGKTLTTSTALPGAGNNNAGGLSVPLTSLKKVNAGTPMSSTGGKKKPTPNKSRIHRPGSHEESNSSGTHLKPAKSMLHKSQVSETEYDRINSDVASEDSTSIEDDAPVEPPPTLQDPEDPFVLWYKETHQGGGAVPKAHPSLTEAVGCFFWENGTLKKADLTLLDIGWSIIQSVEKQPEDPTYLNLALWIPLMLSCLPVIHRCYMNADHLLQLYGVFLHLQLVFLERPAVLWHQLAHVSFNSLWLLLLGVILRIFCYSLTGVLLFIAEKTFQQRLQYAKHFCYLTSSRLARKYHLPHFRLNKVRNIKFWLSLRSYLKKRGPQRSVESIITYVFYLFFFLISIVCFRILTTDTNLLISLLYWEIAGIMVFLSIFIVRFITISTKVTKKYRNLSVLMTEQINLYLTIDKKPHKRDELLLANNTLKLAEDLLKEVDGPFRVCGWSINPLVYNILKVVILSACSAVLSDYCGFKLKLYKIKLNPINW